MKTLLTVEQAADAAGVAVNTVRYWHRIGKLPEAARMPDKGSHRHRVYFTMGQITALCRGICPVCGSSFKRSQVRQAYCTPNCRKQAHRLRTN